uniref:hemicentin-1-like n=1 Tax=Centroberyx gerrardi TaxID=166262 RepID=UPI003AACB362
MDRTSEGTSVNLLLALILLALTQGVLASSAVEVLPSINPAKVGDTVTLDLSPVSTLKSGSWAVGDSLILTWLGDQQAVFPSHSGRVSVNLTTGSLTLSSVTVADSGRYVVQSSDPLLKANATITVQEPVSNVTLRADGTNLMELNDSAVLTCSVSSGSSLSFLWLNSSSEVSASERVQLGDGGSTLTIVNVTRYDQGPFTCNVSNGVSDGISQSVNLTIIYGPDSLSLTVNGQNSTSFITGSNLTMFCSAQSSPPAQLQWAFRGEVLNGTGPELELYNVSEEQSGPYSCLAFNNRTNMNSNITKHITVARAEQQAVNVWLLPFLSLVGFFLSFTDYVCSQEIYASENPLPVGSTVTLSSQTRVTLGTWQHDTDIIVLIIPGRITLNNAWRDRITFNSTSSELSIRSLQLSDSGLWKLEEFNSFSADLTLSVQEPVSNVTLRANATNLVEFNDTAVLICSVSNGSSLSYVWVNGSSEVSASEGVQLSDGGSTLTIVSVTRYDQGPFTCNVSNGVSDEISQPVHLNISYGPSDPTMTIMPMKGAYKTGSNITLSCSAESNPPAKIQWLFDGMYLDQFDSQLQLEKVKANQTGSYKCLVHNTVTSRFSSVSAMVRIVEPISAVVVNRIGGPPILNESFTLRCEVTGPADYIHWWMNGQVVSTNNAIVLDMDNKTLTLNSVQHSDNGYYLCQALNAVSNKTSSPYRVHVNYGPGKPMIMGPSMSLTGQHVTFNCSASSYPPSHFSWFLNGSLVANTWEFVIGPLTLNMSGKYVCKAYNNITGQNSTAYKMLTVLAPVTMASVKMLGAQPILNHTFTLTCETAGGVESIYWMRDGWPLHADSRQNFSMDNATLTFDPVLLYDNGYYQCVAYNPLSKLASRNFTVHVIHGPEKPNIAGPELAMAGHSVTFSCSASSYPPSHFYWFYNGSMVANTSEYMTSPLTLNMSGKYICMAYNVITGKNSTAYHMLTVIAQITDVQIETPLRLAINGYSYMLSCNVTGPTEHVYWMKNGEPLYAEYNRTVLSMDNKTVTFNPVERNDTGYYSCMAVNAVGNMTSPPYKLLVNFGPEKPIIYGPAVAETGHHVVLSCHASSVPPSQFSWFFNGSLVANTSMFKTGPLYSNMSGEYTCMAYNNVTEKNSTNSMMLTVIEGIKSVMVKPNTIPIDTKNLTLTCEVTGPFDSIYWMKDNMHLNMTNSTINSNMSYYIKNNSLHFSPVTVYNDGTYQCVATNVVGPHKSPEYELLVNYGPLRVDISGPDSVQLGSVLTVSLKCYADSRPISEYQWFFNYQTSVLQTGSVITIWATERNEGNYTCKAKNPVTNITMYHTKAFTITGHAAALPLQSQGGLMLLALFALSLPAVSDWLSH